MSQNHVIGQFIREVGFISVHEGSLHVVIISGGRASQSFGYLINYHGVVGFLRAGAVHWRAMGD